MGGGAHDCILTTYTGIMIRCMLNVKYHFERRELLTMENAWKMQQKKKKQYEFPMNHKHAIHAIH